MNDIKFTITPAQLLDKAGIEFKRNSRGWLGVEVCPFCEGGRHLQRKTFAVHATQGNYICLRMSCEENRGTFWRLIQRFGFDPRHFIDRTNSSFKKKKKFVYQQRNQT